jgi:hypothetical protein
MIVTTQEAKKISFCDDDNFDYEEFIEELLYIIEHS